MARRSLMTVVFVLTGMFVFGALVTYLFDAKSTDPDDVWATISTAGAGVALTSVAAGVAAYTLRALDYRRARDDERRRLHREVVKAYNSVKAVRRRMVALGLDRSAGPLPDDRWTEMKGAVDELNAAQLSLEAIKREVEVSEAFARRDEVAQALAFVEKYINEEVLEQWECHGWNAWKMSGTHRPRRRAAHGCPEIDVSRFVEKKYFRHNVSNRLDLITSVLQKELGRR
jgi:hypothetical protein